MLLGTARLAVKASSFPKKPPCKKCRAGDGLADQNAPQKYQSKNSETMPSLKKVLLEAFRDMHHLGKDIEETHNERDLDNLLRVVETQCDIIRKLAKNMKNPTPSQRAKNLINRRQY